MHFHTADLGCCTQTGALARPANGSTQPSVESYSRSWSRSRLPASTAAWGPVAMPKMRLTPSPLAFLVALVLFILRYSQLAIHRSRREILYYTSRAGSDPRSTVGADLAVLYLFGVLFCLERGRSWSHCYRCEVSAEHHIELSLRGSVLEMPIPIEKTDRNKQ